MRCGWWVLAALVALTACDDDGGADPAEDARSGDSAPAPDAAPVDDATPREDAAPDAEPPDAVAPDAMADAALPLEENFGVEETEGDPDCENLQPGYCLLPFPSDRFFANDAAGRRLAFGERSLPTNRQGQPMDPQWLEQADGWGPASPVLVAFPGATLTGTGPVFDPAPSLLPDSRTIIVDAESGERVPHWVETDWLTHDAELPVMVLRPAVPLPRDRRLVVGIRGLVDAAGAVLPAPDGFAALRDRTASRTVGIHARRARFDAEVFPVLEAAGFARAELQLAWDFTTSTEADGTRLLTTMRDRLLAAIGEAGPEYTITDFQPNPHPDIAWRVVAVARVPSFLEAPDATGLRRIRRDAEGLPVAEGYEDVEFTLQIPHVAYQSDTPMGVMQYGHGFLGAKTEADNGWLREMAARFGFLVLAADMQGMTSTTSGIWIRNLAADAGRIPLLSEEPMQGVMNHLALVRLVKGRFLEEADERLRREGAPLYDPARVYYYGNSQGGTMGTLVMSMTTDMPRGVLGVPGCAYPFLLQRSTVFVGFTGILQNVLARREELSVVLGLLGTGFNRLDPLTYAPRLDEDHDVLLHVAKEDGQVHNEVSFLLGRAVGARLMVPAVRPVWGLPEQTYPTTGSAVVEYDFGVPDPPDPLLPPNDATDTHGLLRKELAAQRQMMHFLETGELTTFCDGACDPD